MKQDNKKYFDAESFARFIDSEIVLILSRINLFKEKIYIVLHQHCNLNIASNYSTYNL